MPRNKRAKVAARDFACMRRPKWRIPSRATADANPGGVVTKELLSCLYPKEFSSVRHVVQHKSKDPEIDLSSLSTEELRAFHKTLKKVTGEESEQKPVAVLDVTSEG
jgi:hypothetical protein